MKNIKKVLILSLYVFLLISARGQMVGSTVTNIPLTANYVGSSNPAPTIYNTHLFLPSDYSTNTDPCPLIIELPGTGDGGNTMIPRAIAGGLDITRVKNPLTGHVHHFISASLYDQTNNAPNPSKIRQFILWMEANYNIDPYRIYLDGYSQGGGVAILTVGSVDSFARNFAAVYVCSGGFNWYTTSDNFSGVPARGTGNLFRDYHVMWWGTNGVNDGTVTYSNVIRYNDSFSVYLPASQRHYTLVQGSFPTGGGHGSWEYMVSDTLPVEPSYWNYNDGTTNARGGGPFKGSIYEWFLLFTNSLIPGGNAGNLTALSQVNPSRKYFPILTGFKNNTNEILNDPANYGSYFLCSAERSSGKGAGNETKENRHDMGLGLPASGIRVGGRQRNRIF